MNPKATRIDSIGNFDLGNGTPEPTRAVRPTDPYRDSALMLDLPERAAGAAAARSVGLGGGKRVTAIPNSMRCINCRVPARNGVIVHGQTCPEYGRVSGAAKSPGVRPPVRYDKAALIDAASRYERFTARLIQRRPERFDCPACGARGDGRGLRVTLDGTRIRFHCFGCKGGDEVLRALRMDWSWIVGEMGVR